ncbi:DUF5635 domain-containing protein [Corynebacterium breve]|uniref:DUF5635 domain-containing protein n=1 Tax=Corynebacterium breve TaxID=3049799 RepID=A0ABY8VHM6_9CORY|nr:DUF5635 domain-containing protein [Corynebacterium breve]WIM67758.1 DUF5635 domain-containing protein [Corynebacterium breve]
MVVQRGLERRRQLEQMVDDILKTSSNGALQMTTESEAIDFKEEAGRRQGRDLLPGQPDNQVAATKLADEVACMANSPGGGVLIVGVEDKTGRVIGTELDIEKLRQRIHSGVGVAPSIQDYSVEGLRVLAIYVAESSEPVEDTSGRLRWRVSDRCVEVDRSEWWQHRDTVRGYDPLASASTKTAADVRPGALGIARRWRGVEDITDMDFLRELGALRSDGHLSEAAALLFTSLGRVAVELTQFNVPSGQVLNRVQPAKELSLVEQIDAVESALAIMNTKITVETGLSHRQIDRIPQTAVREAILNGVIHRDWNLMAPTDVRWTDADSMLEVRSPGGFIGEVNEHNILSQREARYPALADLFRAVGLVDKQGVGVDRMYRAMISLGHTVPVIEEVAGPYVHVTLVGGQPKRPVLEVMDAVRPAERRDDYRLSIILHQLLHKPFLTISSLARALQSSEEAARVALQVALQTVVRGAPFLQRFGDAWLLGEKVLEILEQDHDLVTPLVAYRGTDEDAAYSTIKLWLAENSGITTGDLMTLSGMARGTAKKILDNLVAAGDLVPKGKGRSSRYETAQP